MMTSPSRHKAYTVTCDIGKGKTKTVILPTKPSPKTTNAAYVP